MWTESLVPVRWTTSKDPFGPVNIDERRLVIPSFGGSQISISFASLQGCTQDKGIADHGPALCAHERHRGIRLQTISVTLSSKEIRLLLHKGNFCSYDR
jgi:hypothetical protein